MKRTPFEMKIFNHLVQLLMAERTASMIGDADAVQLKRKEYEGFTDALKMCLSERLCAELTRAAIEEVNRDARPDE